MKPPVTFDPVLAADNVYALYRVFNVFIWAGTNNEDGTINGNWNTGAVPPTGADIVSLLTLHQISLFLIRIWNWEHHH
jgi:hypothetical protein